MVMDIKVLLARKHLILVLRGLVYSECEGDKCALS